MIEINSDIFGAVIAFLIGALISYLNYALSKYILKNKPNIYAATHLLRQILGIGYLIVLYLFGGRTPYSPIWLVVGGCLGITIPMFYFTFRLVKLNDTKESKEDISNG